MPLKLLVFIITIIMATVVVDVAGAVSYSGCASELDELKNAAEEAINASRRAKSAEEEYESKKSDYDRCRRFPDTYDFLGDQCRSKYRYAKDAQDELGYAVGRLQSALSSVDIATQDVKSSCGYSFANPATPMIGVKPEHQRMCATIKRLKSTMKVEDLLGLCNKTMGETECQACLSRP